MEKVLIEVALPAADMKYDLFVPDQMQIGTLTGLVSTVFSKLSNGMYTASPSAVLCDKDTGCQYDSHLRIRDTEIRNGSRLILY